MRFWSFFFNSFSSWKPSGSPALKRGWPVVRVSVLLSAHSGGHRQVNALAARDGTGLDGIGGAGRKDGGTGAGGVKGERNVRRYIAGLSGWSTKKGSTMQSPPSAPKKIQDTGKSRPTPTTG